MNTAPLRLAAVAAALLSLAACKPQTVTNDGPADDMKADLAAAKPVELPPAMSASKSFRCKDNSIVFIDFFTGDKQATIHPGKKDAEGVVLKAETAGETLTAPGYTLKGNDKGSTIQVSQPGKPEQSCKA